MLSDIKFSNKVREDKYSVNDKCSLERITSLNNLETVDSLKKRESGLVNIREKEKSLDFLN